MDTRDVAALVLSSRHRDLLVRAGFRRVCDVISLGPTVLAKELSITPEEAHVVLDNVRAQGHERAPASLLGAASLDGAAAAPTSAAPGKSAMQLLQSMRAERPVLTFVEAIDRMLGGGIPMGEVTELCGMPGAGKTQFCLQVAVDAHIPIEFGGSGGQAVYIDTEGSFMVERAHDVAVEMQAHLLSIAAAQGSAALHAVAQRVGPQQVLQGIHVMRAHDHAEQRAAIASLQAMLRAKPQIRCVVIDSITFHHRHDFEDAAQRARTLLATSQLLHTLAREARVAVLVVNQVTTKIEAGERSTVPALGEAWAHACTNRIMLSAERDCLRVARLVKSPSRSLASAPFVITHAGIRSEQAAADHARVAALDERERPGAHEQAQLPLAAHATGGAAGAVAGRSAATQPEDDADHPAKLRRQR